MSISLKSKILTISPNSMITYDENSKHIIPIKYTVIINDVNSFDEAIAELKIYDGAAIMKFPFNWYDGKIIGKKGQNYYYYSFNNKKIFLLESRLHPRKFSSYEEAKRRIKCLISK